MLDDKWKNCQKREIYLIFEDENYFDNALFFIKNQKPDKKYFVDNFFRFLSAQQENINNKEEKLKYFFKNFNRTLFSSLTTAEYIFISTMFLHNIQNKWKNILEDKFNKTLSNLFRVKINKNLPQYFCFNISSAKEGGDCFTITKKNLENMVDNLFFPLKSYLTFSYYNFDYFSTTDLLGNLVANQHLATYSIIHEIKSFYKKKAFEDLYTLFFMSFWGHCYDRFLEEFDFKGYSTFMHKIRQSLENHKNTMKINKNNIYETKEFFNFLYFNASRNNRKELTVVKILPFLIGHERHLDLMKGLSQDKDLQYLQRSLECLRFSIDSEDQLLQTLLAERMTVLLEKIKLSQEKEANFFKNKIYIILNYLKFFIDITELIHIYY